MKKNSPVFFSMIVAIASISFIGVLYPFLVDIFLAVVLAHVFNPTFRFFCKYLKCPPSVAALLSIVTAVGAMILPLYVIGLVVTNQAMDLFNLAQANWMMIRTKVEGFSYLNTTQLGKFISLEFQHFDFQDRVSEHMSQIASFGLDFARKAIVHLNLALFHTLTTLLMTYYVLVDGSRLKRSIVDCLPVDESDFNQVINETQKMIDATLMGTVVISLVEAAFGALLFYAFNIPSVTFWAIALFAVSVVPVLGSSSVYIPVGVAYFFLGHPVLGVSVAIIGFTISHIIQNIVKPKLVGRRAGLHPGIYLVATLGGLFSVGIIGFLVGPLLATVVITLWKQQANKNRGIA